MSTVTLAVATLAAMILPAVSPVVVILAVVVRPRSVK